MQFTSVAYMVFLFASVCVYYALPGVRSRTWWLLLASVAFYWSLSAAWTAVLAAVMLVGYACGRAMERAGAAKDVEPTSTVRRIRAGGIAAVVGVLAVFKYLAFATGLLNGALSWTGAGAALPLVRFVLPIGVSFWTFSTIAYLVDVSRGTVPAERDFARYALFVSFFAHVGAGPIARAGQLMPQFGEKHRFDYNGMRSGLLLAGWGVLKKLVIADPLGVVVGAVFRNPQAYPTSKGLVLGIAAVAFTIQIYCDFSGYTDIARGSARLFGVELLPNFNNPYMARSMRDFWRRWHMTLMNWLRDYVYFPLGGSRVSRWRRYANILAVFLVSGIWHGAGFTFVAWGLLNGLYQVVGDLTKPARDAVASALRLSPTGRIRAFVQWAVTIVLVIVGWVFFRANSLSDALYILPRMFLPTLSVFRDGSLSHLGLQRHAAIIVPIAAAFVFGVEFSASRGRLLELVTGQRLVLRWAVYLGLIVAIVALGFYGPVSTAADFAYFKF